MSRHRKVKALDYEDEYDDYYNAYDDDEDFNEDDFEARYLNSGIDLNASDGNNFNSNKNRQTLSDEIQSNSIDCNASSDVPKEVSEASTGQKEHLKCEYLNPIDPVTNSPGSTSGLANKTVLFDSISPDLTKLAIKHLDKHQWQLPLMEMDKKFRDKTYYKHYNDTYISSLRSKLGHFLADNQLQSNPMKYHMQKELDNHSKYSRMFELLTDYYQSLGGSFFSFATPSPDEQIVIGCRLGTKAKKQTPKPNQPVKSGGQQKTPRFEFHGTNNASAQPSTSKSPDKKPSKSQVPKQPNKDIGQDLTIRENFTTDQLNELSRKYQESMKIITKTKQNNKDTKTRNVTHATSNINQPVDNTKSTTKKVTTKASAPKQLPTLSEIRNNTQQLQALKRGAEPSSADLETFKKQSIQTAKEYNELIKCTRPRVNLVVVGHVDAGKSTLVGHLLFKLGQISGKQMHRMEVDSQRQGKASFKFAWAMDETAEERSRGVTIDIALTKFETPHREVILLDAPGHVDFIPAVISGAAQADAALLVVDATRGEFETGFTTGGQTREHTFLVRSLGVKSLIVVVNKMDNVGWNWSRFSDIVDQLNPFLKQVGFNLKEDVQYIVCSGLTGENLVERRIDKALKASSHPQLEGDGGNWNSIPSLLEAIDKIKPPERMVEKPSRICVTDVFKGMSSGVFLGAKVVSGKIEPKQKLILLPPGEMCEIKQVESRESKATRAFAGDIVTTVATGIDMNQYYRGCILCDPIIPCQVTNRFQARIIMFQSVNTIIIKGSPIEVHINGSFESGEVRRLISLLNKNSGELVQKKPRCIAKNSSAIIQLKLSRVVCCELYEDNKDLGRFMMRSYGKTIAAGLITKIKSPKVEKNRTKLKSK